MAANLKQGVPQEVSSERTISERANFGLGVVRTSRDMMKKNSAKNDLVYVCNICEAAFTSSHALSGHQNYHKRERALEMKHKKIGESSNSHQANPNNNSLSGENSSTVKHSSFTLCDFKPISCNVFPSVTRGIPCMIMTIAPPRVSVTPYHLLTRNTSYGSSSTNPLPVYNYNPHTLRNLKLSLGPTNCTRDGSSRSSALNSGVTRGIMTMVPPVTPYRFFVGNTNINSPPTVHLPSYKYGPHILSNKNHLDLPLGTFMLGGGITRETPDLNLTVVPRMMTPYQISIGNTGYISSSRDHLPSYNYGPHVLSRNNHLDLSLRPFDSEGGSNNNNNNSVYPGGVNRGIPNLNVTILPPMTPNQNLTVNTSNGSSSRNHINLINRNIPPPPSINISNNTSSSEEKDSGGDLSLSI